VKSEELYTDAVELLRGLIRIPSFSREEDATANLIATWLSEKLGTPGTIHRKGNNVWVSNLHFDSAKPTILLCSHHDTVRPGTTWTRDPFDPSFEPAATPADLATLAAPASPTPAAPASPPPATRLYGLGSNDAGASAVSLAAAFRHFYRRNNLTHNLILALVAEEEISGSGGVRSILPELDLGKNPADFAVVGEPTGMQLAIAERGLMVLDCVARGRTGHAARDEGDNAIYHAVKDIEWLRDYRFPRKSPLFGEVKMSVTIISAGTQHNVVPDECRFTVDCRVTEQYTNEEVLSVVRQHVTSEVTPRSVHLRSSSIDPSHPIVEAGKSLGMTTFGSPTTSDQVALTMVPSVKVGPGQSARSHSADEYIELAEIKQGISLYINLLEKICE
jgi:acetylornithine deacetylase